MKYNTVIKQAGSPVTLQYCLHRHRDFKNRLLITLNITLLKGESQEIESTVQHNTFLEHLGVVFHLFILVN